MGAGKPCDEDREPLLAASGESASGPRACEAANGDRQPVVAERRWQGGLLQCCGSCGLTGWGSCLIVHYLPCLAYGQNVKRGLRQSAWLHGLLFVALFFAASWLSLYALGAANHNVLATCNGRLPHPHPHPHPQPGPGWVTHPEAAGVPGALGRGLWGKWEWPRDDDDHHHAHHEHDENDDDDNKPHPGHDEGKEDEGDADAHSYGKHRHEHEDDGNDGEHHGHRHGKGGKGSGKPKKGGKDSKDPVVSPLAAGRFQTLGTFDVRKFGPADGPHSHPDDERLSSPECQQAVLLWIGAVVLVIATALVAVHYAAQRRTMLRKQFGIAGSKLGDFCAWWWCAPCALCQETRTMWANNVHEGVWHGPAKLAGSAAPTVPAAAPPAQFMTTSTGTQACQG